MPTFFAIKKLVVTNIKAQNVFTLPTIFNNPKSKVMAIRKKKKVIIIGGGVAGMSAAHELIERKKFFDDFSLCTRSFYY